MEEGDCCCVCYKSIEHEVNFPECCHRVCSDCWKRWEFRARLLPDGATCPKCRSGPYELFFRPPRTREVSEDPSYVPSQSALADAGQTTSGVRTRSQHLGAGLSAQREEIVVMGTSPCPRPTIPPSPDPYPLVSISVEQPPDAVMAELAAVDAGEELAAGMTLVSCSAEIACSSIPC